ncbi:MAG: hypothetical protein COA79_23195 [Planctomycetota bacterium]|nr:MAG: hypothetical protein COA79_23195 [Planctomycetota bacterium]
MPVRDYRLTAKVNTSGFIVEPEDIYREKSKYYLSSHQLSEFRTNPKLFHKRKSGLIKEVSKDCFIHGSAVHKLVLEGQHAYNQAYSHSELINPATNKPFGKDTKAYKSWSKNIKKQILTEQEHRICLEMQCAVLSNKEARVLFGDGFPEKVIRFTYNGFKSQSRIDWFNRWYGIVDLKTCRDISRFIYDIKYFGYLNQLAFYRKGVFIKTGVKCEVYIIAVEKIEPYRCEVYRINPALLDLAEATNEKAMVDLGECKKTDVWIRNKLIEIEYL